MLSVSDLSKSYRRGVKALDSVNLDVPQGMFGLLGPNGAGKTTFMRIISTLLRPDTGRVVIDGVDVLGRPEEARRLLGYLPQEFGTYPSLTVREYLDYLALLSGLGRSARRRRIDELLEWVNLGREQRKPTRSLSGGMKRRLGIAQALLGDPRLLIVDEPTAGLDPEERVRFRNLLADLAGSRVVLLSTHIVEDVSHTCDKMAILRGGRILYLGETAGLIRNSAGRVWTMETDEAEAAALRSGARVTSTVRTGRGVAVRVVADERPGPGAEPAEPTLEDAYLDIVGRVQ